MFMQILVSICKGITAGAIAGGIGYIKNETWETFDPYKFVKTLVIGAFVGGITGASGMDLSDTSAMIGNELGVPGPAVEAFIMTAIVGLADNLVKILARRTDLGKLWKKLKKTLGVK